MQPIVEPVVETIIREIPPVLNHSSLQLFFNAYQDYLKRAPQGIPESDIDQHIIQFQMYLSNILYSQDKNANDDDHCKNLLECLMFFLKISPQQPDSLNQLAQKLAQLVLEQTNPGQFLKNLIFPNIRDLLHTRQAFLNNDYASALTPFLTHEEHKHLTSEEGQKALASISEAPQPVDPEIIRQSFVATKTMREIHYYRTHQSHKYFIPLVGCLKTNLDLFKSNQLADLTNLQDLEIAQYCKFSVLTFPCLFNLAQEYELKKTQEACLVYLYQNPKEVFALLKNAELAAKIKQCFLDFLTTKLQTHEVKLSELSTELAIDIDLADLLDLGTEARKKWDDYLLTKNLIQPQSVLHLGILSFQHGLVGLTANCESYLKEQFDVKRPVSLIKLQISCSGKLVQHFEKLLSDFCKRFSFPGLLVKIIMPFSFLPIPSIKIKDFETVYKVFHSYISNDIGNSYASQSVYGFFTTLLQRHVNEVTPIGINCWLNEFNGELRFTPEEPFGPGWREVYMNLSKNENTWDVSLVRDETTPAFPEEHKENRQKAIVPFKKAISDYLSELAPYCQAQTFQELLLELKDLSEGQLLKPLPESN